MSSLRIALTLAAVLLTSAALAGNFSKGDIVIESPWARATPAGAAVGAGYLKITNKGKEADRLTKVTLEGAEKSEIHEMRIEGGTMQMRALAEGVEIKPGATVELKPGSNHLMFMGLEKPLTAGTNVKGSLTFAKAGTVDVEFKVEPIGAKETKEHQH